VIPPLVAGQGVSVWLGVPIETGDHLAGDAGELSDLRERHVLFINQRSNGCRSVRGDGLLELAIRDSRMKARLTPAASYETADDVDEIDTIHPVLASLRERSNHRVDRIAQDNCRPLDPVDGADVTVLTISFCTVHGSQLNSVSIRQALILRKRDRTMVIPSISFPGAMSITV
jgi:hypothetical protein